MVAPRGRDDEKRQGEVASRSSTPRVSTSRGKGGSRHRAKLMRHRPENTQDMRSGSRKERETQAQDAMLRPSRGAASPMGRTESRSRTGCRGLPTTRMAHPHRWDSKHHRFARTLQHTAPGLHHPGSLLLRRHTSLELQRSLASTHWRGSAPLDAPLESRPATTRRMPRRKHLRIPPHTERVAHWTQSGAATLQDLVLDELGILWRDDASLAQRQGRISRQSGMAAGSLSSPPEGGLRS